MAKKLWTIKDGIYTLLVDTTENRKALANHISSIVKKQGGKSGIKGFKFGETGKPYRLSTTSIKELLSGDTNSIKFKPENINRGAAEVRPGGKVKPGTKNFDATQSMTEDFKKYVSHLEGHTPEKLQQYFDENDQALRKLRNQVAVENRKLIDKGFTPEDLQRVSRGHDQRLSLSVDSPRNLFIELLDENIKKGNRYSPSPAASIATGNPIKEGLDPLENWSRDYRTWLDKPEHGGSGVLSQRGDYSDLLEQRIRAIGGDRWQSLSDTEKLKITNEIDDIITDSEKLNQWLPSEGAERRKWGLLTPDQATQSGELLSDGGMRSPDTRTTKQIQSFDEKLANQFGSQQISPAAKKIKSKPNFTKTVQTGMDLSDEMTTIGRMGSLSKFSKAAAGLNAVEAAALMTTNPVAGGLAMVMQTPMFQKRMASVIAKTGARMIPGVSFGSGALAAGGYMMNGQWTKAGIQLLAGAIGEVPGGIGDAAQSAIELGLTVHDIRNPVKTKAKTGDIDPNVKQSRFGKGLVKVRNLESSQLLRMAS